METPVGVFHFTRLEKVIFGPGQVQSLGNEMDRRGLGRALIATGRSLGASTLLDKVRQALGSRCVGVFAQAAQHVPAPTVRALAAEIERCGADTVVSFGGGSPIDTVKVAIASVMNERDMTLEAGKLDWTLATAPLPNCNPLHIAVPTTLSAGEYTAGGGVTSDKTGVKAGVIDPRLQPRVVVNDPELTMETPNWLWISTGIRAIDHAVEAAYSTKRQVFTDLLATEAIRQLVRHLPASVATSGDAALYHRGECQTGAWLSLYGMINSGLGISHAIGHKIGPTWNVPHGYTSCITLPTSMRFMANVAPQRFGPIAAALGIPFDAQSPQVSAVACADRIREFIAQFDVPHSLKEAQIPRDQIQRIVGPVHDEVNFAGVVERSLTLDEVATLIEAIYDPR